MDIGVLGCAGRMGRAVLAEILASGDCGLAGGVEAAGHPALGQDLGVLAGTEPAQVVATSDASALLARADVVIEFSAPEASARHAALAADAGTGHVIGTSGLSPGQAERLAAAAARTPIVWAANMSLGTNLLIALAEQVARTLGPDAFDIEIVEMHHRHKVDAPSGTALAIGEAVARGRRVTLTEAAVRGRDGLTGERPRGAIGFAALRGGDVVGEHTVLFAGTGERLELTHRATDRRIYARGALAARPGTGPVSHGRRAGAGDHLGEVMLMAPTVDFYYSLQSPWTYLGFARFREIAARSGAEVAYRVIQMAPVFAASGGLPLAQRPKQRQAYRLMELARWRDYLGTPLNLHPTFFPVDERLAAGTVIAHGQRGGDVAALSQALLTAVWAEERNLADPHTLQAIARAQGADGAALLQAAESPAVLDEYQANTETAVKAGVFGVPTFVIGDQLFWGQDRLDFVARALQT